MAQVISGFVSSWVIMVGLDRRPGEIPEPRSLVVLELERWKTLAIGAPKLLGVRRPPYPTGPQALIATFGANDLMVLHLALGWRAPERVVDLAVEFRNLVNGRSSIGGKRLYAALLRFGVPASPAIERNITPREARNQVTALARLFEAMSESLDLPRALLRGRYMLAVARIEALGTPVDTVTFEKLMSDWPALRDALVTVIDRPFGFHQNGRFDAEAFAIWLDARQIEWPLRPDGTLDLSDVVFRDMVRAVPELRPIKELQTMLSLVKPDRLAIGRDGRNRLPLRPFASRTARNQPRIQLSVLGSAAWLRHLVRPERGRGIALIDWAQQEFGIAAAFSGDPAMQQAYLTGDPYLELARSAGATNPEQVRDRYKACALGVQYGMGAATLVRQAGISMGAAQGLLLQHRRAFPRFWEWSDSVEAEALLAGKLETVFGWQVAVGPDANPRFLRNFPMQANGAEMLRLACCAVTEVDIRVCATLHDALLIEAPIKQLDTAIATTERLMKEASEIVLDDFSLRTTVTRIRYPQRLSDPRGKAIWQVLETLTEQRNQHCSPVHQRDTSCPATHTRPISLYVSKKGKSDDQQ